MTMLLVTMGAVVKVVKVVIDDKEVNYAASSE